MNQSTTSDKTSFVNYVCNFSTNAAQTPFILFYAINLLDIKLKKLQNIDELDIQTSVCVLIFRCNIKTAHCFNSGQSGIREHFDSWKQVILLN